MAQQPPERPGRAILRVPADKGAAPPAPAPLAQRLSKRLAEMLPCSRSEAEQYIAGGWVSVDGQVVEEPQARVLPSQAVVLADDATLAALAPVTLLLHKPPGYEDSSDLLAFARAGKRALMLAGRLLEPATHWAQDPASQRLLKRHFAKLAVPVPLDRQASGLLVFTQDGRVARRLTEDAALLEHEYTVEVAGEPQPDQLVQLNQARAPGATPGGRAGLPSFKVSLNSSQGGVARLRFAFKGHQPGLLERVCAQAGWPVLAVRRQRLGRVALAQLPQGQWRYLGEWERF